jgi:hypothetical protein
VLVLAVHLDLVEHREGHAPRGRAVLLDVVGRRELLQELVAREAEHAEAAVAVLLLQLLERRVLGREAAAGGDVHDEQHLARVLRQ